MHPQQKHARFNLIVIACAVVPAVLAFVLLYMSGKSGMPVFAFFAVTALWAYGGRFYHKSKDSPTVTMDERDQDIQRKAMVIAWRVDWLFWGALCMVPFFVVHLRFGIEGLQEPMIPVDWLPPVYMAIALVHMTAWSIAVLILYGKGSCEDDA